MTHRSVSLVRDQWEVGKVVAEDVMGTSRNKVIEDFWAWYLRVPGAKLPERPPADAVKRAFAEWHEREAAKKAAEDADAAGDQPQS